MARITEQAYLPVYLRTLLVDTISSFDIYVRFKDDRMVLFHSGTDRFTAEVRKKLIENNITIVYIKSSERDYYTQYVEKNLKGILADPDLPPEQKSEIAHVLVVNIAKEVFNEPDRESIMRYKASIGTTMDYVLEDEDAITNLIRLTSYDFTTYTHSVNVGVFGIGLAKAVISDTSKHDMKKIAAALFLHDLGKSQIPREILTKHGQLTKEEWKVMKQHPLLGYKLLQDSEQLTPELKAVVLQHHERNNGSGYPLALKGDKIHLYSKICMIADVFEALTARRPYKRSQKAFDALKIMQKQMVQDFDPQLFQKFVMLFSDQRLQTPQKTKPVMNLFEMN